MDNASEDSLFRFSENKILGDTETFKINRRTRGGLSGWRPPGAPSIRGSKAEDQFIPNGVSRDVFRHEPTGPGPRASPSVSFVLDSVLARS
ncbi:hypothetical protein TNCV_2768581 [Trichonephila clavipes]|nr:hypothetical protein TNCV_2768581 [Trichonephila clavipes]